jgi:hypothetical protein
MALADDLPLVVDPGHEVDRPPIRVGRDQRCDRDDLPSVPEDGTTVAGSDDLTGVVDAV